ncbi:hypothetical protein HS1genome_1534 [Sulfodiicoccus acidiphilus]|uniref:Uncharacterized protein n=1 Tax=Sulfodiicoccus acidiphilus TaxID=1670455 RepID=A0A348B4P3_9CREN|nr:hypothetical protein [Sulfodiicoccus acidiphilus]BBD73145.1 hypothetical protein HS1genome_1534 [Sulfodiicoccus acidiphilus]GGU00492.1 hypothetical protein GCM10007116_17150 [Sulfodiicoccus acidiphilus]
MRGELGRIDLRSGKVEGEVERAEELASLLKEDCQVGEREAIELGFRKLNGFVILGEKRSIAFAKNVAVIVDNSFVTWDELFVHYGLDRTYLTVGAVLTGLSLMLFYLALGTSLLDYFAPEPRLYTPILMLLLGLTFLGISKSRPKYRFSS